MTDIRPPHDYDPLCKCDVCRYELHCRSLPDWDGEDSASDTKEDRIVYSAGDCGWWDHISKASNRGPRGLPCCPGCGAMLFETPSIEWWNNARLFESDGHSGYVETLEKKRGACAQVKKVEGKSVSERMRSANETLVRMKREAENPSAVPASPTVTELYRAATERLASDPESVGRELRKAYNEISRHMARASQLKRTLNRIIDTKDAEIEGFKGKLELAQFGLERIDHDPTGQHPDAQDIARTTLNSLDPSGVFTSARERFIERVDGDEKETP